MTTLHAALTYSRHFLTNQWKNRILSFILSLQYQVLEDEDTSKFIDSQVPELQGLQKMEIFDIKPMSTKPYDAGLLSSIWSDHRKWSPIWTILKYKA